MHSLLKIYAIQRRNRQKITIRRILAIPQTNISFLLNIKPRINLLIGRYQKPTK